MLKWKWFDWLFGRYRAVGTIAVVVAGLSAILAMAKHNDECTLRWIVALWSLVPPIWFFFELHWARERNKTALNRLKESQGSAAAVWAGLVAFLTVLYLKS